MLAAHRPEQENPSRRSVTSQPDSATSPTLTRRGDQEGRRRDILAAAATLLAERSWDGFTMRDVAARAGLSSGAVYQYFEGKRHIFAALFEEQLRAEIAVVETYGDASLHALVGRMLRDFAELYLRFGRHHFAWTSEGVEESAATQRLGATFRRLADTIERTLGAAAAHDGRVLEQRPGLLPFLWSICNGVGDQLIDERYTLHDCTRDEFLDFATDGLVEALTRPSDIAKSARRSARDADSGADFG
jgi:AcrR family transcriptional regulator